MPYSKDPQAFPSQFFNIAFFLQQHPGHAYVQAFEASKPKEANAMRQKFFAWRRALSREGNALAGFLTAYECQLRPFEQIATRYQQAAALALAGSAGAGAKPSDYIFFVLEPRDHSRLAQGIDATLAALSGLSAPHSAPHSAPVPNEYTPRHEELLQAALRVSGIRPSAGAAGDGAKSAFEQVYGPLRREDLPSEGKEPAPGKE
jgi:hypothetical protein